jgi:HlyD family secretion protein
MTNKMKITQFLKRSLFKTGFQFAKIRARISAKIASLQARVERHRAYQVLQSYTSRLHQKIEIFRLTLVEAATSGLNDRRVTHARHMIRSTFSNIIAKSTVALKTIGLISDPDEAGSAGDPAHSLRTHLRVGAAIVALLVVGVGGWASFTQLAGAVIAPGQLVVDSNVKKVQHPTGGVVGQLFVDDGSLVKAGDVLVHLDETQTKANLGVITTNLDELAARQARDEAERDGETSITFPASLLERQDDPQVAHAIEGERKLFELRRSAREGQKQQLRERITQLKEEIRGMAAQEESKNLQIDWIGKELSGVRELWEKNLVPMTRVSALERESARLLGERGQAISSGAQTKGKINETELQILQIDQDARSEVSKDLSEIRAKVSELSEKRISAEDMLKRVDIRAPQNGVVHQLNVHTIGGVITPGEPIMLIIPENDALAVETKIQPQDIDQVHIGQLAVLKFSAFNQRTTPELNGAVTRISADVSQDPKSGATYYSVRIGVSEEEKAKLNGLILVPGMPVESYIQTTPRTVLSYLTRPLADQIGRAFKEK